MNVMFLELYKILWYKQNDTHSGLAKVAQGHLLCSVLKAISLPVQRKKSWVCITDIAPTAGKERTQLPSNAASGIQGAG